MSASYSTGVFHFYCKNPGFHLSMAFLFSSIPHNIERLTWIWFAEAFRSNGWQTHIKLVYAVNVSLRSCEEKNILLGPDFLIFFFGLCIQCRLKSTADRTHKQNGWTLHLTYNSTFWNAKWKRGILPAWNAVLTSKDNKINTFFPKSLIRLLNCDNIEYPFS